MIRTASRIRKETAGFPLLTVQMFSSISQNSRRLCNVQFDKRPVPLPLPDFIIPYCSYSLFFILRVLGSYFLHLYSVEKLCEKFSITQKQLYKWIALFRLHKAQWLGFIENLEISSRTFLFRLGKMEHYSAFSSSFVSMLSFSFLQAHANPKNAVYCQHVFSPDYQISMTTQPYQ